MINGELALDHPIRWGMIGGGRGSQIGYIHRSSALRDRNFDLMAGAFDIDPARGEEFGVRVGVSPDRCYGDYKSLFEMEGLRGDGVEAVSIATPNHTHYEICKAALNANVHVICEKPLCFTSAEAQELTILAAERDLVAGVMYGYAGHQMIEEARQIVARGDLGDIRLINMQFAHGAYNTAVEIDNAAAKWRMDPALSGPSFVLGDLGTHPLFLAKVIVPEFDIQDLMCVRKSFVEGRLLEDNAFVVMNLRNGGQATLWASAVNCGSLHGQKVRVIGSRASLEWWDERPNQLSFEIEGEPARVLERGSSYLDSAAMAEDRIGAGHPEGLFEAWSNLYRRFALAIDATSKGESIGFWYPDVRAGADGVRWIEKCVESAERGAIWVEF